MKKILLPVALSVVFMLFGCGGSDNGSENGTVFGNGHGSGNENGFEAVDVGECRLVEPAISFRDRIYTENEDYYSCNEYVEVTETKDKTIKFNWFGEMHCGEDWEYGYKVEGIEANVLKVSILERDTDPELTADCDSCCYLMPIKYTASTAEEIESIKAIEINYEGKNHKASFEIK